MAVTLIENFTVRTVLPNVEFLNTIISTPLGISEKTHERFFKQVGVHLYV